MTVALDLAVALATRPGFDCLHDGNPVTSVIEAYHDPVGYPTQGYGRLLSRVPFEDLSKYPPITLEAAWAWVCEDMRRTQRQLRRLTPRELEPHQEAALLDFVFNCGSGNYQTSALRAAVLRGDFAEVPTQLRFWRKSAGRILPGLVKRREAEVRMFLEGR